MISPSLSFTGPQWDYGRWHQCLEGSRVLKRRVGRSYASACAGCGEGHRRREGETSLGRVLQKRTDGLHFGSREQREAGGYNLSHHWLPGTGQATQRRNRDWLPDRGDEQHRLRARPQLGPSVAAKLGEEEKEGRARGDFEIRGGIVWEVMSECWGIADAYASHAW